MTIRFRRLTPQLLNDWITAHPIPDGQARYRLRLWKARNEHLPAIEEEARAYFDEAFDDARKRLRRGFEDALSPFDGDAADPARNYPRLLNRITLQGYFGEALGVLAVEHFGALGHNDWVAPALLFRLHDQEFQHLEAIHQRLARGEPYNPDAVAERRVGRTGDDGLLFRMDEQGRIVDVLVLEGKCLSRSNAQTIREAHENLCTGLDVPSGIRELINLLDEYETEEAQRWQSALIALRAGHHVGVRHDGLAYAVGAAPRRQGKITWLPEERHNAYTGNRNLEGMEFHFENLDAVIDTLYRAQHG